ncbi:MAG: 4-hydroxy-tetrahydrodipicolinate reductase [Clostridia bacterium]|nr:4-hydroxy-tetrahydrodipicolinate reductase [Clostridia bacterium]MBR6604073.1 4-hydroxy-tetrahydrodipicolinate reductase [Clostridia bacterium]
MKVIVCGASGKMGKELIGAIEGGYGCATLAAATDIVLPIVNCPAYTDISAVNEDADVIIDFSHHSATKSLISYALGRKLPIIIATTGQTDEEKEMIKKASEEIPVFYSGNMSIGIALLVSLVKQAVRMFPDADVEITEVHHNQKVDVPSGTALMLAEGVKEAKEGGKFNIGRHENGKREKGEIGIHSLRMGKVVGEHEVRIDTGSQTITLSHKSHSRALFAEGALTAANYLMTKERGLYSVNDMLG